MPNKKIIVSAVLLALLVLAINVAIKYLTPADRDASSSNLDSHGIAAKMDLLKNIDFSESGSDKYFKESLINKYSVRFFKFLQTNYKDIGSIRKYLYELFGYQESEKVDSLIEIYKKYLIYEKRLAEESSRKKINSSEDFTDRLLRIKKIQVDIFGEKNADILFGETMKTQEYPYRISKIINDNTLYGREKENIIRRYNSEMWGSDADEIEKNKDPHVKYSEKVKIYSKDLNEMPEMEKNLKLKQFREEFFSAEEIRKFEESDKSNETDRQKELDYQTAYKEIISNKDFSEDEKKNKIIDLQNKTYGEKAASILRMVEMEEQKTR